MKSAKWVLIAIGLILAVIGAFFVISIVTALLPYIFIGGIVLVIGAVGYKLFANSEKKQLAGKTPIDDFDFKKAEKTLEEYKRKYLPK